jgi:uncharacterized membrane protein
MNKGRLEAFSDGVFAIVITLLILDVRVPDVPITQLWPTLLSLWPRILAHVMTFLMIGMYWVFHHHGLHRAARTDGVFVWLNLVFLLFISFLPFPTSMLGRYPGEQLPVMLYGLNLIAANATGFLMVVHADRHRELLHPEYRETFFKQQWPVYVVVNGVYALAIAMSFINAHVSTAILGGVIVVVMVRSAIEKV